ncbi:hypothetical protein CHARACLAT_005245 [Characodon lateralis]|uniref:Uncharacterized protein n=1 Tax=Characodon lateralis TaxID=208331 RepID=A0ABU7E792_9TELE|nr:hypothetical protein [Characodon lateralis]
MQRPESAEPGRSVWRKRSGVVVALRVKETWVIHVHTPSFGRVRLTVPNMEVTMLLAAYSCFIFWRRKSESVSNR